MTMEKIKRKTPEEVADALYRCRSQWQEPGQEAFHACRACPYNRAGSVTCPSPTALIVDAWTYMVELLELMKKLEEDGE